MGVYLNSKKPCTLFKKTVQSTYFVDKTAILEELIPIVEQNADGVDTLQAGGKDIRYLCITRPRRFGKTTMASMIASFFGKSEDARNVFQNLSIGRHEGFEKHLNKHNVIYITFSEIPNNCKTYAQYINRIENRLIGDLRRSFPNAEINGEDSVWDALNNIYELEDSEEFIFVLDEWDFLFHQDFARDEDKKAFLKFLNVLLKDQPYVEMVYMTGILPIAKYSSGSELNMFFEYTMATREKYSEYFGFTEDEVDDLYLRYRKVQPEPKISREGLDLWYDGYLTLSGKHLFNPRSVVGALCDNQLGSYWTSSGPYDEIFYYVKHDIDQVRNDIALMVSGTPVPAKVQEYAATSMNLTTKNEVYSAMVVYGFLTYVDGHVSIPNKEIMDKFAEMIQKEPEMGAIYQMAKESETMLRATKAGDTETMTDILEKVHNTESPRRYYNNEAELAAVLNIVYLQARDTYRVEREHSAGAGYADLFLYPYKREDDCIIIEFKVDCTADEAIQQIKDRNYAQRFVGKAGEPVYTGRILAVGIAYFKGDRQKKHSCKVEVLREKL